MISPKIKTNHVLDALRTVTNVQHSGGQWARIRADWRGGDGLNVSVNIESGGWHDFATGEAGSWQDLARLLHIDDAVDLPRPIRYSPDMAQEAQRIANAQYLWNSGFDLSGTVLPLGWDSGLSAGQKGIRRRRLESAKTATSAYLAARLGDGHLVHWMRQVRIALPKAGDNYAAAIMLTPMLSGGLVTGVERTWISTEGKKLDRKFLGISKGASFRVNPPFGVPCRVALPNSPEKEIVGLAESFLNAASIAQEVGIPLVCSYSAAGMVDLASRWAADAAKLDPAVVAAAPVVVIAADRDVSGVGQKAAAKSYALLSGAGIDAKIALPAAHENGGPDQGDKGSDWNDYPTQGIGILPHFLGSMASEGWGEIRQYLPNPAVAFRPWRPAQKPAEIALCVTPDEARQTIRNAFNDAKLATISFYQKPKSERGNYQPRLIKSTMGSGKTTREIRQVIHDIKLLQADIPVVVQVQNHDQALEFERAGWFHLWGRHPEKSIEKKNATQAASKYFDDAVCLQWENYIEETSNKNHLSGPEVCRFCPNGIARAIRDTEAELIDCDDSERAEELEGKLYNLNIQLESMGLKSNPAPCSYLDHAEDAKNTQFVVMVSGSYSPNLAKDALFICDEGFPVGKTISIGLEDLDLWARQNQKTIQSIKEYESRYGELSELQAADLARRKKIDDLFSLLAQKMAGLVGQTGNLDLSDEILRMASDLLAQEDFGTDDSTVVAGWEKLEWEGASIRVSPLRAAFAIAETLHYGGGYVDCGKIIVAASNPIFQRIKQGLPTVFFDATPDIVLQDIVSANDGIVVNAIAEQKINIHRYPSKFFGLGALDETRKGGKEKVNKEIARYRQIIDHFISKYGIKCVAFLMHKRAFDLLFEDGLTHGVQAGWWGLHQRAQNRWAGNHLVILGGFYVPELDSRSGVNLWKQEYQVARVAALSCGVDPAAWPILPGGDIQKEDGAWVTETGHEVQSRMPLPVHGGLRRLVLSRSTAEAVQAQGRARGMNLANHVDVHAFGGLPLSGIGDYGVDVFGYFDSPVGQDRAQYLDSQSEVRQGNFTRMDAAAAQLISAGEKVTEAKIREIIGGYPAGIQEWISSRAPYLARWMSTTGRNAKEYEALRNAVNRTLNPDRIWAALDRLVRSSHHQGVDPLDLAAERVDLLPSGPNRDAARILLGAMVRPAEYVPGEDDTDDPIPIFR